jgi:AcrR family transcriptional regulator
MFETLDRRDVLLDKIVDALLEHGVADLSLRPLAAEVGTSARLLIYHFGSKERLLVDALRRVRTRVAASLVERSARERPASLSAVLLMFWNWATEPANQNYFRLLFEVDGLSMFNRLAFSDQAVRDGTSVWLALIERSTTAVARDGDPTLIMGAMNGLLQDFLTTGDLARTTAALHALIALLPGATTNPASPKRPQA